MFGMPQLTLTRGPSKGSSASRSTKMSQPTRSYSFVRVVLAIPVQLLPHVSFSARPDASLVLSRVTLWFAKRRADDPEGPPSS
jgi:hypothetical protein